MVEGAVHGGDGRSWRRSWRFGLQLEFVRWGSAMSDCKIGLALGGGSARGWAHIGVLRALNEAGIYPDIIAGTSIGAVVGGCYVAGELACARAVRARADAAQGAELPRLQFLRLRPDQRPAPVRHPRQPPEGRQHRGPDQALRRGRHRDRHRSRDLAVARQAGRRHARLLRAAGHLPPRRHQRSLAVRRRAGQPDPGLGVPRARRPLRDRGQPHRRLLARHGRPPHGNRRARAARAAGPRRYPSQASSPATAAP